MKKNHLILPLMALMLITALSACKKDKYTIENKAVTGTVTYTQSGFVPLEVDPVTQQPLKAQISFTGSGTLSDLGELTLVSTFVFDFVAGQGSDFETTYTGASASDSFSSSGSSVMTENMVFTVTETFIEGKGKFDNIEGGGDIHVELVSDGSSGTGDVSWVVTY